MRRSSFLTLFLVLLASSGSVASPRFRSRRASWLPEEEAAFEKLVAGMDRKHDVRLSLQAGERLSQDVLLVGGSYREVQGSLRSCLFLSHDGGEVWREVPAWLHGSEVVQIVVADPKNWWVLTAYSRKRNKGPYRILYTKNRGKTWGKSISPFPQRNPKGMAWPMALCPVGPNVGQLRLFVAPNKWETYETVDQGRSWFLSDAGVFSETRAPNRNLLPPSFDGVRSVVDFDDRMIALEQSEDLSTWHGAGTMPYLYRVEKGNLVPLP